MSDDVSGLTKRDIEAGRLLFARDVTFMLSAVSLDTLPPARLPEICFAGRSNVGKSSLINALTNRKGRVFLLIDSRHGVKDSDLELMGMLDETAVTYQVVMTKVDKLKKGELEKVLDKTQKAIAKRPAAFPEIICTSSEKKRGLDELRAEIATLAL